MNVVSVLDAVSLLAALAALGVLLLFGRRVFSRDLRLLLTGVVALTLFRNASNLLEWSGITAALDTLEDYSELLLPISYFLVVWAFRQQQARRKLSESAAMLQSIFRAAPVGIGVISSHILEHVNERMCEMVGYSREELLGRNARMLCPTDDDYECGGRETYAQVKKRGTETVETRWQRKDGTLMDVLLSSTPVDPANLAAGVTFTALDITDRRRAEEALRRSEAFLNATGQMVRVGGWELDAVTKDVRWTEETYRIHEVPLDHHPPLDEALSFYHPEDRPTLARAIHRALDHGEPYDLELRFITAKGRDLWVHTICTPHVVDGKTVKLTGTFQDISERKRAEEEKEKLEAQLRQAQKMEAVGQLAGGVAHDFNNILTTILGNAEISFEALKSGLGPDDPVLESLRQIQESAQRAADLTRQLLVFSRQDAAQPEVLDLNRTLAEMEKMLRRLVTEDIALRVVPAPAIRCIRADAGQIEQLVMNLVVNARDAMPDGGRLTLEAADVVLEESYVAAHAEAQPGPHVLLAVSDTGCGMDNGTLERIFEPFFTTKPAGQGTGLGLATVYAITKHAGGHIMVYSEPGRGTTFKIYLPAVEEPSEKRRAAPAETAPPTGSETVLVCEDDRMVRHLAAHLLRDAGYTVIEAENGAQALHLAAEHGGPIHLLVTDVIMPDMNGAKLAEALTAARPEVRTLFVSGYTSNVIAHHGVLDEGVDFLEKPFSRRALLHRVRDVLDRAVGSTDVS